MGTRETGGWKRGQENAGAESRRQKEGLGQRVGERSGGRKGARKKLGWVAPHRSHRESEGSGRKGTRKRKGPRKRGGARVKWVGGSWGVPARWAGNAQGSRTRKGGRGRRNERSKERRKERGEEEEEEEEEARATETARHHPSRRTGLTDDTNLDHYDAELGKLPLRGGGREARRGCYGDTGVYAEW